MGQCTGECCMHLAWDRGPDEWADITDGAKLMDSFIEVTLEEAVLYREYHFPVPSGVVNKTGVGVHHYLCRHFNEETHRCGIYDSRTEVCTDYPYDRPCVHCGFEESPDIIAKWIEIHAQPRKRKRGRRRRRDGVKRKPLVFHRSEA